MTIEKKVTLPILAYYDEKLKAWTIDMIDAIGQADWNETNELASGYIKNKPEGVITVATLTMERESDDSDEIIVSVDGTELTRIWSSHESIDAKQSFIANSLVSYFDDESIPNPETYNGDTWNAVENPIIDMTEENGPYLVFVVNEADGEEHIHIKCLKDNLTNYVTQDDLDAAVEQLRTEISNGDELEII